MNQQEKDKLLQKAGRGVLTPEEQEKLDHWYAAFDVSGKDIEVFRNHEHEEAIRTRLFNRIIAQVPESKTQSFIQIFSLKPANWLKVAAVLAFFIISFSLYNRLKVANELKLSDAAILVSSRAQTGKMIKVVLEDGSEIWLNAGSEFKYPKHFNEKNREVYLNGEAFFKVIHDEAKPFIVHTGKLKTTVLGTSFNIRAYPTLNQVKVTVATGKVGITAAGKTLCLLNPNQQINYNPSTGIYEVAESSAALASVWQDGKIRLDGVSFKELSVVVKNTWGLTLQTKSSRLMAANYKTTFNINNKIEEVMKAIAKITAAKYRIRDNIITMYE